MGKFLFAVMCMLVITTAAFAGNANDEKLLNCAKNGDLDCVKQCLSNGADVNARDEYGDTPLVAAIRGGVFDVVEYLVGHGADIDANGAYDRTPLMQAAWNGWFYSVKYLVEQGANINAKDSDGDTVLMQATHSGELEIVKYLVAQGADINAKNNDGDSVLIWAANEGYKDVIEYLIEHGADINSKNNDGQTLLDLDDVSDDIKQYMKINKIITDIKTMNQGFGRSHWKTASGNFNGARLVSDSVAGVVLGTAGGLITSSIIKKNQTKNGFENLKCVINGQFVSDYGDEFTVGIQ